MNPESPALHCRRTDSAAPLGDVRGGSFFTGFDAPTAVRRFLSFAMPTVPFAYPGGMNWEDCATWDSELHGRAWTDATHSGGAQDARHLVLAA